ncbi:hypothetical protein GCM10028811_35110 [Uliginosibacterium sediminicola]
MIDMNAMRTLSQLPTQTAVLVGELELTRRRIRRALKKRERYRYVEPEVLIVDGALQIASPCCSRNVDPAGGVIDIARIEKLGAIWSLYSREHEAGQWLLHDEYADLDVLLQVLCADPARVFWP